MPGAARLLRQAAVVHACLRDMFRASGPCAVCAAYVPAARILFF